MPVELRRAGPLGLGSRGHAVAGLLAEEPRRLLREGVAVALAVGRPHECRDDVELPLAHLARLPPEVGEPQVDVEFEQIDSGWTLRHGTSLETRPDGRR